MIREFFTMIMMVDLAGAAVSFHELSERLARKGAELSVRVEILARGDFQGDAPVLVLP